MSNLNCYHATERSIVIEQLTKVTILVEEKPPELTNRKGDVFDHWHVAFDLNNYHGVVFVCLLLLNESHIFTRKESLKLDWDLLPHAPYRPDFAPLITFCCDL